MDGEIYELGCERSRRLQQFYNTEIPTGFKENPKSVNQEQAPDSTGGSLALNQDFLQDFVAYIGDMLILQANSKEWAEFALPQLSQTAIGRIVNTALKNFAEALEKRARAEGQTRREQFANGRQKLLSGGFKLLRQCRPQVAHYFRHNSAAVPVNTESLSTRLQGLGQQLSLDEIFGLLDKVDSSSNQSLIPGNEHHVEESGLQVLGPIREVLMSSDEFQEVTSALWRLLYCDDRDQLEFYHHFLTDHAGSPPSGTRTLVIIRADWDLYGFLRSEYGQDLPHLGSAVVLTGAALRAQASMVKDYVQALWPDAGVFLLNLLQLTLETGYARKESLELNIDVAIELGSNHQNVTLSIWFAGLPPLIEMAQAFAWLGCTLRMSSTGGLAYSHSSIALSSANTEEPYGQSYDLTFHESEIHGTEDICWLQMFSGAVIAPGFPAAARGKEVGLELPLQLLAELGGVRHAVVYEGGVVLKGFSHMFVPILKEENRIQWHAISSKDSEVRLTYADGLAQCLSRALVDEVSLEDAQKCRAFLGWCSRVEVRLGSDAANYENIDYSTAGYAGSSVLCTGATLGLQNWGVGTLDFKLGAKAGPSHRHRTGTYRKIVSCADQTPILLYDTGGHVQGSYTSAIPDTGGRRAWLVSSSALMLHMFQHSHSNDPFKVSSVQVNIDTNISATRTAKDILLEHETTQVLDGTDGLFKDTIMDIWSRLEFLLDQKIAKDQNRDSQGGSVEITHREYLTGYEYNAVVEDKSPYRLKEVKLVKNNGGWLPLVNDIDALVLFANDFGDVYLPKEDDKPKLCHKWHQLPTGLDYMATTAKILLDLYTYAGSRLKRDYLTSTKLQWHQGRSLLFGYCDHPRTCHCSRLQQIYPRDHLGSTVPPNKIQSAGAVIFGKSEMISWQGRRTEPQIDSLTKHSIYSIPNLPLPTVEQGTDSVGDPPILEDPDEVLQTVIGTSSGSDSLGQSSMTDYSDFDSNCASQTICPRSASKKRPISPTPNLVQKRPELFCQNNQSSGGEAPNLLAAPQNGSHKRSKRFQTPSEPMQLLYPTSNRALLDGTQGDPHTSLDSAEETNGNFPVANIQDQCRTFNVLNDVENGHNPFLAQESGKPITSQVPCLRKSRGTVGRSTQ
ncbi:hypothetical protein NX059_002756 [Plenodomus lindquistii]|nr:hypothetical protein NX059_002756 [Plenodomus lindquistii]